MESILKPRKSREGVRTLTVVEERESEGGGRRMETGKSSIIKVDTRSSRGSPDPTRMPLYYKLPSTTILTGRLG